MVATTPKEQLKQRIAQLSAEKRAVLQRMLAAKEAKPKPKPKPKPKRQPMPGIRRRPGTGPAPLSSAQRRMWLMDQLTPGSFFFNEHNSFRFPYALNVAAFRRAVDEIVRRHEILRTTFATRDGEPVQIPGPAVPVDLPLEDLRGRPAAERLSAAAAIAEAEAHKPCDLHNGPLLWVKLLRLGEHDYLFLLTMHHIVCDGWSMEVFFKELTTLYEAFAAGRPSPLPEMEIQYADYAAWQDKRLREGLFDRDLDYWKKQLDDLPVLELPTDRARPAVQTFEGARANFVIPEHVYRGLVALSQSESCTMFILMLAAFQALLHRYTGQDDIVVGAPTANRNHPELAGLIGFFVNTLVMRADAAGDPSFREFLGRVRGTAFEAYGHQELPFERLVEVLRPDRDMSRNPLFQVIFQVFNWTSMDTSSIDDATPTLEIHTGASMFDLRLDLIETAQGFSASFEYSTVLFDRGRIERMIEHFQTILRGIVDDPDMPLSRLPVLSAAERARVLVELNDTATDYPRDSAVPALFESQAAATPDAVAVVAGDVRLSYGDLNKRVNRLAHHLRKQGVGRGSLVAIYMDRSVELVVSMLAVLKAGGAFLPLDLMAPEARLREILSDNGVGYLVSFERRLKRPPKGVTVVALEQSGDALAAASSRNPKPVNQADDLAYVMFTSGSTGHPKGVMVPHRGIVRLVMNADYFTVSPDDVFLQFAPTSFDAATFEVFGPLLNGARVALYPPEKASVEELAAFIEKAGITVAFITTGLFHQLVEQGLDRLWGLRQLFTGGDFLSVSHMKKAFESLPDCNVVAAYGPTENTTYSSMYPIEDPAAMEGTVPLGRPIANSRMYVLDDRLNPVPIGVAGEIYLAGDGLAQGYLNQEELTTERFLDNPLPEEPGEILYKTGDLGRLRADGNVEMLGRADRQVKLRGFRIELDEIEAVLGAHDGIQANVVVARQVAHAMDKQLVAYVVPKADARADLGDEKTFAETLRSFLHKRVPEYMVPGPFVFLDSLPLNQNGKVDRKQLPDPAGGDRREIEADEQPRTDVERQVAEIWADVLDRKDIGIRDNFFDLGGHSLLATRVVSRIRGDFGIELPLRILFESPDVASVAEAVSDALTEKQATDAAPEAKIQAATERSRGLDLDALSEDEVDALLSEFLETEGSA